MTGRPFTATKAMMRASTHEVRMPAARNTPSMTSFTRPLLAPLPAPEASSRWMRARLPSAAAVGATAGAGSAAAAAAAAAPAGVPGLATETCAVAALPCGAAWVSAPAVAPPTRLRPRRGAPSRSAETMRTMPTSAAEMRKSTTPMPKRALLCRPLE